MKKLKRTISILMSACLTVSALSGMLTLPSVSVLAEAAPQASYTYDFTDALSFDPGVVETQIPGSIKLSATEPNGKSVDGDFYKNMKIITDTENIGGLGKNAQYLILGKDFTTSVSWSVGLMSLNHPYDKIITDSNDSKTISSYPIKKLTADVRLPASDCYRGGFVFSKGMKTPVYNSETKLFDTAYTFLAFGYTADKAKGLVLSIGHFGYPASISTVENKINAINLNFSGNPPTSYDEYYGTNTKNLASLAIDSDGNALNSELISVLNKFFSSITALTNEESWTTFEISQYDAKHVSVVLSLNLSRYQALRAKNPGLPEVLRVRLPISGTTENNYGQLSANNPCFSIFGMLSGSGGNKKGSGVKNITVEYDIPTDYSEAAEEFETSFLSAYNTLVADILKAEDLAAINTQISAYNALPEGAKNLLASNTELHTKLSTLKDAKEALEDGAYFFDAFEGELNWKIASKITGTTYDDNLEETNVYSDAAATAEGDNGKAFWGIHTDKDNEYNKALYLRKSFNQYNMDPEAAGNVQKWPSVLYVLKDGIIPANSEIEKITGKIYHSATHYKHATGILNYYEGENRWDVATITGSSLQKVSKLGATNINYANGAPFRDAEGNELNTVAATFKTGQWVDFSLTYIEEKGVYEFTVNGIAKDGVSQATLTGYTEKVTADGGMVDRVGLFHGSQCRQTFDNIAVTLKSDETQVTDIAPEVLGARILKQATDNNQNLRIDVDFTKAIADSEKIAEYGVILQAGTQTKDTLIDANNTTRTVLSYDPAVNAIPETMIVTVSRSAANDGKRVTAIAYVKDTDGNYHYSNNDVTNSAGQNVVTGGLANKSVIGVMKSWYSDLSVKDAANIATAIKGFAQDGELDANTVKEYIDGYIAGTYTTTSPKYATCKEYLRGVFYKYYSI